MAPDDSITRPVSVGNSREFALRELAEKLGVLTEAKATFVHEPLREKDSRQGQPDIAQARAVLDWEPTTDLERRIVPTIAYFRQFIDVPEQHRQ